MTSYFNKKKIIYGPNYNNVELKKEKFELQDCKDLLTGEKLDFETSQFHHVDYDKNNDAPDNHIFISINSHIKITRAQRHNPIEAEWYKRQLQENLRALKEKRSPNLQKVDKTANINEFVFCIFQDDKKPTISSRIEKDLYESIKSVDINQFIKDFIRKFLRDSKFREDFSYILYQQFDQDFSLPLLNEKWFQDTKVVSCRICTIEKELLNLYFTFLCNFTLSDAIRTALIHFRDLDYQAPLGKDEIIPILKKIFNINK